jgi:hypothetical protein
MMSHLLLNFNSTEENGEKETIVNGISQFIQLLNKGNKSKSRKSKNGDEKSTSSAVLLDVQEDPFGLYCTHVISQSTSTK